MYRFKKWFSVNFTDLEIQSTAFANIGKLEQNREYK